MAKTPTAADLILRDLRREGPRCSPIVYARSILALWAAGWRPGMDPAERQYRRIRQAAVGLLVWELGVNRTACANLVLATELGFHVQDPGMVAILNQVQALAEGVTDSRHACRICGRPLETRRADARSCSPACRQRAYRMRRVPDCTWRRPSGSLKKELDKGIT